MTLGYGRRELVDAAAKQMSELAYASGYAGNGWITLVNGGRFTQAQVTAHEVRYSQTVNVADSPVIQDSFTFTVRDSAFGYDVWTDPANPTAVSAWPANQFPQAVGGRPRSATIVITRPDGKPVAA